MSSSRGIPSSVLIYTLLLTATCSGSGDVVILDMDNNLIESEPPPSDNSTLSNNNTINTNSSEAQSQSNNSTTISNSITREYMRRFTEREVACGYRLRTMIDMACKNHYHSDYEYYSPDLSGFEQIPINNETSNSSSSSNSTEPQQVEEGSGVVENVSTEGRSARRARGIVDDCCRRHSGCDLRKYCLRRPRSMPTVTSTEQPETNELDFGEPPSTTATPSPLEESTMSRTDPPPEPDGGGMIIVTDPPLRGAFPIR